MIIFFFLNYYEKRKEIIRDKEEENCVLQGLGRDKETIKTTLFRPYNGSLLSLKGQIPLCCPSLF